MCFKRGGTFYFGNLTKNNLDKIKTIISETWANYNVKTDIRTLKVEEKGAQIIEPTLS